MCNRGPLDQLKGTCTQELHLSFSIWISFCVLSDFSRDARTTPALMLTGHHCSQLLTNYRSNGGQCRSLVTGDRHLHAPVPLGHYCALSLGDTQSFRVDPISFLTHNVLLLTLR